MESITGSPEINFNSPNSFASLSDLTSKDDVFLRSPLATLFNPLLFSTPTGDTSSFSNIRYTLKENAAYLKKIYIIEENDSLSVYNKIPLGRNSTNGAVYSKIYFKVEICSALSIFIPRFISHANTEQY